mmetsp:Transcript_25635/g.61791  ORF Transcript_25635/g.61791 Transcript_25635/m.61791 type:complete len:200 (+) Transcript_25635:283-882(+)
MIGAAATRAWGRKPSVSREERKELDHEWSVNHSALPVEVSLWPLQRKRVNVVQGPGHEALIQPPKDPLLCLCPRLLDLAKVLAGRAMVCHVLHVRVAATHSDPAAVVLGYFDWMLAVGGEHDVDVKVQGVGWAVLVLKVHGWSGNHVVQCLVVRCHSVCRLINLQEGKGDTLPHGLAVQKETQLRESHFLHARDFRFFG